MASTPTPAPSGYAITSSLRKGLRYFFTEQLMQGFAGGLNLRDAPTELVANESPSCWNVTLDERGGVVKRLGYSKWNASAADHLFQDSYYSLLTDLLLWYSPADGKLYTDPGTGVLTLRHTFTAGSRISMVDFVGNIYAVHPVDGLYSSPDGITWTLVSKGAHATNIPKGSLITAWQNKLWIAGDPNNINRLYFSAAGDATDWDSADGGGSNNIRDKDDAAIVALRGAVGYDYQTKPGLFVFKQDSIYRITDSSTAAYVTIDGRIGAASKNSVTELYGEIIVLSRRGIYQSKKLSSFVPVGEKIFPLFDPSSTDDTKMANWCVGFRGDRVLLSVTRQGSSVNDLALEYAPLYGWIVAGSNAMGCYQSKVGAAAEVIIGASPTVTGQLYKLQDTGGDDGADITSWFETRWYQVSSGHAARMNLARLLTRCTNATMTVYTDFETVGTAQTITTGNITTYWNSSTWNGGIWNGAFTENYLDTHPRAIGRAFKIRIDETSQLTYSSPDILSSGASLTQGGWALYAVDTQYAPLGLS